MANIFDDLHDAVLERIQFLWEAQQVEIYAKVFERPIVKNAEPCVIVFHQVKKLSIPREDSWGPSIFVNGFSRVGNVFQIEIQSGDVIEIVASNVTARKL